MSRVPLRVLILVCLVACTLPSSIAAEDDAYPGLVYIQSAEVKAWLEEGKPVTFLDVREPDEFAAGHLPDAVNIVWNDVETLVPTLPHDQPIVLYCIHSAHRAKEAAQRLRARGFDNAVVLEGGIVAWHAGGAMILASNPTQSPSILPKTERCAELSRRQ